VSAEPARSIERLGFRRWYERQLTEGHAWLISFILCALAIVALLELTGFRLSSAAGLLTLGVVYVTGLVGWHSFKRYRTIMQQAERLSQQSTCKSCSAYAAFSIIAEHPRISVRCLKCAHEWTFH
jgi:hypothetical protein